MTRHITVHSPVFDPWELADDRYDVILDKRCVAENVSQRVAKAVIARRNAKGLVIPEALVPSRSRKSRPMHYATRVTASSDLSLEIDIKDGEVLAWSPFVHADATRTRVMLATLRQISLLMPGEYVFKTLDAYQHPSAIRSSLAIAAGINPVTLDALEFENKPQKPLRTSRPAALDCECP